MVEWEPNFLSWEEFRSEVLGSRDGNLPSENSLRALLAEKWEELGLAEAPFQESSAEGHPQIEAEVEGVYGVFPKGRDTDPIHGSASPFESLAERVNWLMQKPSNDNFGRAVQQILDGRMLSEWLRDAQVGVFVRKPYSGRGISPLLSSVRSTSESLFIHSADQEKMNLGGKSTNRISSHFFRPR